MSKKFDTPILLIGFNRPALTRRVLAQIKKVKPSILYVAIDGPRNLFDAKKIEQVKEVIKSINWKCRVEKKYSKVNLGCKNGPVGAIDWFFENENMGIILEDDILPDPSFFYFCQALLEKYKNHKNIGSISGNNFVGISDIRDSYMFSKYSQTWGWATWRRVWKKYDPIIRDWPTRKKNGWLKNIFSNRLTGFYWTIIFDAVYKGELRDVWDYQWTYMSWKNNLLTVIPNKNLANNIGIGVPGATHTLLKGGPSRYPKRSIDFPLRHPKNIKHDVILDRSIQKNNYVLWKEMTMSAVRKLKKIIPIKFI